MAINNLTAFHANTPNFRPIEDATRQKGKAIYFTDSDGDHEHCGRFIQQEWKSPRATLTGGQRIQFERKSRLLNWTVVILWGSGGTPECLQVLDQHDAPIPCTLDDYASLLIDWESWAERNPHWDARIAPGNLECWTYSGFLAREREKDAAVRAAERAIFETDAARRAAVAAAFRANRGAGVSAETTSSGGLAVVR